MGSKAAKQRVKAARAPWEQLKRQARGLVSKFGLGTGTPPLPTPTEVVPKRNEGSLWTLLATTHPFYPFETVRYDWRPRALQ